MTAHTLFRMAITREPVVIPTRTVAYDRYLRIPCSGRHFPLRFFFLCEPCADRFVPVKVLLTMGLQRETAGRGSLAIYVQVFS